MRIIRAGTLGFCPGVRMAVKAAEEAVRDNPLTRVFILGQIVHNPRVSARLAQLGARELPGNDGSAAPPGSLVVVRSHGASPQTLDKLTEAGVRVIDATCPKVAANQRTAAEFARKGFTVVIAGDRGHGETLGVAGHAPGSLIVSDPDEARAVDRDGPIALVAQTTMGGDEYAAIRDALALRYPDLVDCGGICGATRDRRAALERLCSQVDAVVVVGGRNSANTRRLAEYARALGKPAWHVETADEIPAGLAMYATVGLTAGASTPNDDVDEAERRLLELGANHSETEA